MSIVGSNPGRYTVWRSNPVFSLTVNNKQSINTDPLDPRGLGFVDGGCVCLWGLVGGEGGRLDRRAPDRATPVVFVSLKYKALHCGCDKEKYHPIWLAFGSSIKPLSYIVHYESWAVWNSSLQRQWKL